MLVMLTSSNIGFARIGIIGGVNIKVESCSTITDRVYQLLYIGRRSLRDGLVRCFHFLSSMIKRISVLDILAVAIETHYTQARH